jgi:hypothetical protein
VQKGDGSIEVGLRGGAARRYNADRAQLFGRLAMSMFLRQPLERSSQQNHVHGTQL